MVVTPDKWMEDMSGNSFCICLQDVYFHTRRCLLCISRNLKISNVSCSVWPLHGAFSSIFHLCVFSVNRRHYFAFFCFFYLFKHFFCNSWLLCLSVFFLMFWEEWLTSSLYIFDYLSLKPPNGICTFPLPSLPVPVSMLFYLRTGKR